MRPSRRKRRSNAKRSSSLRIRSDRKASRPPKVVGRPVAGSSEVSARMRAVRHTGTTPELAVRRRLAQHGIRYRLNAKGLPGSPDLVNVSRRFVVFVHGCFWHRHTGCLKTTTPRRNRRWWQTKFNANVYRDRAVAAQLKSAGFRVVTVWECEALAEATLDRRLRCLLPKHRTTSPP